MVNLGFIVHPSLIDLTFLYGRLRWPFSWISWVVDSQSYRQTFVCPKGDKDSCYEITLKEYIANSKAHYSLLQALNDDDVSRVINYTCTYDIWQDLITTHEGTSQVKKAKIDLHNSHMIAVICLIINL